MIAIRTALCSSQYIRQSATDPDDKALLRAVAPCRFRVDTASNDCSIERNTAPGTELVRININKERLCMSSIQTGADALDVLNQSDEGGNSQEFAKFSSNTSYTVKVLGTADLISFFSYGIYRQVNSFVAEKPSKKSRRGFPIENLTPWDKAWKYHADKSKEFGDKHSQEAYKYRARQRFAMGFIDLDTGEPIIVDLSKNQAQAVHGVIKRVEKRLDRTPFELSKDGQGTSTTVSLTPLFPEDLDDKQTKNFEEAPKEFDMRLFEGILYEMDEDEQIEKLIEVGFDVSLIGLEAPAKTDESSEAKESAEDFGF